VANFKPGVIAHRLVLRDGFAAFHDSHEQGDRHNRQQVRAVIIHGSRSQPIRLLIENSARKDPDGERWHFKGFMIPAGGTWIHVQGWLRKATGEGQISAQRQVRCPKCEGPAEARWVSQTETFCKLCGTELWVGRIPTIV